MNDTPLTLNKRKASVMRLFSLCLEATVEMGLEVSDVEYGNADCEPWYARELGNRIWIVEGDYTRAVVRIRDVDGFIAAQIPADIPTALAHAALAVWGRVIAWEPLPPRFEASDMGPLDPLEPYGPAMTAG